MSGQILRTRLMLLFAITIYFQQVLVFNFKASFKIYEILLVLCTFLLLTQQNYRVEKRKIPFFLVFFLFPLVGLIFGFVVVDAGVLSDYYSRFPSAREVLRFNHSVSTLIICIFYLLTFFGAVFVQRSLNERNVLIVIRFFILAGFFVNLYAVYGFLGVGILGLPDIVPDLIDFRNTTPDKSFRPSGFSSEPGTFIYMLSWQLFFMLSFGRRLFGKSIRVILLSLLFFVLLLTLSSLIVILVFSFFLAVFLSGYQIRTTFFVLALGLFLSGCVFFVLTQFLSFELVTYLLLGKLNEFISAPSHTCGSGAFRAFTNSLGVKIFLNYPTGVGPSGSYFLMQKFEGDLGIKNFCEMLSYSNSPQSSYVMVLSEFGIHGFLALCCSLILLVRLNFRRIYPNPFLKNVSMASSFFVAFSLVSIFPVYSFFIWFPIILFERSASILLDLRRGSRSFFTRY